MSNRFKSAHKTDLAISEEEIAALLGVNNSGATHEKEWAPEKGPDPTKEERLRERREAVKAKAAEENNIEKEENP